MKPTSILALTWFLSSPIANAQWNVHLPTPTRIAQQQSAAPNVAGSGWSGGGDECATATVIVGQLIGVPFDLTSASTGSDGQMEQLCAFGPPGIDADLWWRWTADADGLAILSTCTTLLDTKVAVYPDACPPVPGSSVACRDNSGCASGAVVSWAVEAGATYLFQVGMSPGVPAGTGFLDITIEPAEDYQYDTGEFSGALGVGAGGSIGWLQSFAARNGADTLREVHVAFGTGPLGAPGLPQNGDPATIAVWDDPDNDGDPSNAVLLHAQTEPIANAGLETLNVFPLSTPVAVSGTFFVGAVVEHGPGIVPAPMDNIPNSLGRAWLVGEVNPPLNLNGLDSASFPVAELRTIMLGFDSVWLVRAVGAEFPSSCNGDGGNQLGCTNCPCSNESSAGTIGGCLHSAGAACRIEVTGTASVSAADLRVELRDGPPNVTCQLTSGSALAPANAANPCFGLNSGIQSIALDGLRCVVQGVLRHGVRPSDSSGDVGVTTNGWGTPNGFFQFSAFVAGSTRHFQAVCRDDPAAVCTTGLNTSQAITVEFEL